MDAYAILAGGGTKGIALAGCLQAAEEIGIQFQGYGGTSGGALVALLAAVGYSPDELVQIFVEEAPFDSFFPDSGHKLTRLQAIPRQCTNALKTAWQAWGHWDLVSSIRNDLGLYDGDGIDRFVRAKVKAKLPKLKAVEDIHFHDLPPECKPLKIVASNISKRRPITYSWAKEENGGSIFPALKASMCYPFAFKPVRAGAHWLVDGGLSSNLPSFLFHTERETNNCPAIAFDLVPTPPNGSDESLRSYCVALLDTALRASDVLLRQSSRDVIYVPVELPSTANALDIQLTRDQRVDLLHRGRSATLGALRQLVPHWRVAANTVESLQARFTVTPPNMHFLLREIALSFQVNTNAREVRAHVMVPTGAGTLITIYQHGMDHDPDVMQELKIGVASSGEAWTRREMVVGDYVDMRKWGLQDHQRNMVRHDRRAVLSIPLFSASAAALRRAQTAGDLPLIGILTLDSSSSLSESGWIDRHSTGVERLGKQWGGVVSRVLT